MITRGAAERRTTTMLTVNTELRPMAGVGEHGPRWCAASPASRPCGPATPSTEPLGSRCGKARTLVQQLRLHRTAEAVRPPRRFRSAGGRREELLPVAVRPGWPGCGVAACRPDRTGCPPTPQHPTPRHRTPTDPREAESPPPRQPNPDTPASPRAREPPRELSWTAVDGNHRVVLKVVYR